MSEKIVIKTNADATATTPAEKPVDPAKRTLTLNGKKINPTCGVFMISNDKGTYKYIGTSTRIEVCVKDYFKWLTDEKHGNADMQKAFNENGKKLNYVIVKECTKEEFAAEKAAACKKYNIAMKVPFTKEVVKPSDIKVPATKEVAQK